jgi:hypothetical protein
LYSSGGVFRALEAIAAADLVVRDALADFDRGDRAFQCVGAVRLAKDDDHHLGLYVAYRSQRNPHATSGGKATDVVILDFAGRWELLKRPSRAFSIGWEVAGITGKTTEGRTVGAEMQSVAQFAAAVKASLRLLDKTFHLDAGYASGDHNPSDDRVQNFKADRDFKVGLILFDQVLAYQSARAVVRGSDPSLVGTAPESVERLATQGAVTSAWYLFPRLSVVVTDWASVFGGPLFAFSTAKLTDPVSTQLSGGTSVNALGASAGRFLGTELDLGAQLRFSPSKPLTLASTFEFGVFLPGDAFRLAGGALMGPVGFGRIRLLVSL